MGEETEEGEMGTTDDGGAGDERGIVGQEEKILVSVRLRPLNEKEIARNDVCDWECVNESTIVFKNRNLPVLDRSMYPTAYTFGMQLFLFFSPFWCEIWYVFSVICVR